MGGGNGTFNVGGLVNWLLVGAIIAVILACVIVGIVSFSRKRKKTKEEATRKVDQVTVKGGVRYTKDQTIVDKTGNMNISYDKQDIILAPRKAMKVSKDGPIIPGKYTVLSASGADKAFNIRVDLYVRELKHGEEIILAEGQEITPTSATIILR